MTSPQNSAFPKTIDVTALCYLPHTGTDRSDPKIFASPCSRRTHKMRRQLILPVDYELARLTTKFKVLANAKLKVKHMDISLVRFQAEGRIPRRVYTYPATRA